MLAVDEVSFPVTAQESAREAVTRVVDRVSPGDYLGMVTFPGNTEIAPTTRPQGDSRRHSAHHGREGRDRLVGSTASPPRKR